jgi:DNA-binding GntR family transcriptional regulator
MDSSSGRATSVGLMEPKQHLYVSKTNMVTAMVREEITDGTFPPGSRLRQRELAERYHVSVTPVREALRRLESEGLVTYDAHFGACVVEVDFGPTIENFLIRGALESLAAGLAATRLRESHLSELEGQLNRMNQLEGIELARANMAFHLAIYGQADSPLLNSFIRRLWQPFDGGPTIVRHREQSEEQHRDILQALRNGDSEGAAHATRVHVLTGLDRSGRSVTAYEHLLLSPSNSQGQLSTDD